MVAEVSDVEIQINLDENFDRVEIPAEVSKVEPIPANPAPAPKPVPAPAPSQPVKKEELEEDEQDGLTPFVVLGIIVLMIIGGAWLVYEYILKRGKTDGSDLTTGTGNDQQPK